MVKTRFNCSLLCLFASPSVSPLPYSDSCAATTGLNGLVQGASEFERTELEDLFSRCVFFMQLFLEQKLIFFQR